jgi:transcriptional regulator with XRE-family HTH domain
MPTKTKMNTKWFRDQLADRQLSQRGLAKLLDLDPAAVSLMLRGQRRMTSQEAKRVSDILGVPVTEVLRRAGIAVTDDVQRVPVTGYADEQGVVTLFPQKTHDSTTGPADCPSGTHGIQVRAPGMPQDGWLLFVSPAEHQPGEHLDQLCTAALESGQQVISVIRRGYRSGTHNLLNYPSMAIRPDCKVVWVAPVLWIKPA